MPTDRQRDRQTERQTNDRTNRETADFIKVMWIDESEATWKRSFSSSSLLSLIAVCWLCCLLTVNCCLCFFSLPLHVGWLFIYFSIPSLYARLCRSVIWSFRLSVLSIIPNCTRLYHYGVFWPNGLCKNSLMTFISAPNRSATEVTVNPALFFSMSVYQISQNKVLCTNQYRNYFSNSTNNNNNNNNNHK